MEIGIFKYDNLISENGETFATRKQLQEMYGVAKKTLADNINALKIDGLVVGRKFAHRGSIKNVEHFNTDEIISIGFRLRSNVAINFQRWSRTIIKAELKKKQQELIQEIEKRKYAERELAIWWNKTDAEDLYR